MLRLSLSFALVTLLAACVGSPANGAPVAATGSAVSFSGYDLSPSRQEALTSVGGPISLELLNTSNGDLQGFDSLLIHAHDLSVLGGTGDAAWYGLFPTLDSVAGNVHVRTGHSTYGVLRKLTTLSGSLSVEGSLLHTEGVTGSFPLLGSVSGNLTLSEVGTTGSAAIFTALTDVGGTLHLEAGGVFLTSLALGAPAGVNLHGLELVDNTSLASWTNDNWHVVGSGPITIFNHPSLFACTAEDFVATQQAAGWTGTSTLSGNALCAP